MSHHKDMETNSAFATTWRRDRQPLQAGNGLLLSSKAFDRLCNVLGYDDTKKIDVILKHGEHGQQQPFPGLLHVVGAGTSR